MAEHTVMVPAANAAAMLRQAGLLVGIAASVAIGVWVVLWARTPDYSLLYGSLPDRDVPQVMQELQAAGIAHRIDHGSGSVLVAADQVHAARMKLAAAGLPRSAGMGFELLEQDSGFGTSKFVENARFQRALEGELARTIAQLANVRSVRVHLAIPKETVFMRARQRPSASVLVDLYSGRRLEDGQIGAIVHLVSASVPAMQPDSVTVVDQSGHLLTSRYGNGDLGMTAQRFDYATRVERSYAERIEQILAPVVGHDGVRAQVTAELDFTTVERTSERFNPDLPAVRSEQTVEEERAGGGFGGVPGALSNEPPAEASAPEVAAGAEGEAEAGAGAPPRNSRRQAVRNYEIDKTISHTRLPVGSVRRLSVAVVVNNKSVVDAQGNTTLEPLTDEELSRITALVKEAIGFDAARGDTVNVLNAEFKAPAPAQTLPEPPLWEQPWVLSIAKQLLGALVALLVAFGVIRPVLRNLMRRDAPAAPPAPSLQGPGANPALPPGGTGAAGRALALAGPGNGDLDAVRSYVAQEPKLAAQVVKSWVGTD